MQENGDENECLQMAPPPGRSSYTEKPRVNVTPTKSLVRFRNPSPHAYESRTELPEIYSESLSSTSKPESLMRGKSRDRLKMLSDGGSGKEEGFGCPKFVVSDCWKATSGEIPGEFVEIFKEDGSEGEDSRGRVRKQRLVQEEDRLEEAFDRLSYTKEFHVLTEVQKSRILNLVEETIKKLASSNLKDCIGGDPDRCLDSPSFASQAGNLNKVICKKFLLPWVIMKLLEIVVCHIIQLTFLSNELYFQKKSEFLPVVVTYYFTLSIIILSLVMHITCYACAGFQHACYFMCVISSTILTLTSALGILIMLCSMKYYKSFREILVLVFVGVLLCTLAAELCICYVEVKNFWNRVHSPEQYCIS